MKNELDWKFRWVRKGGARMGDGRVEKNNLNKSRQACFTIKREGYMPVVTGYIQVIERKG